MKFGQVYGVIVPEDGLLRLTVTLEETRKIEVVRTSLVPVLDPDPAMLDWQADQYTQETIGNELAELGWEAFSRGDSLSTRAGIGQSYIYTVRNL